jgi:2,4-diketo-3-deoxy-L-fuconate hydrolase
VRIVRYLNGDAAAVGMRVDGGVVPIGSSSVLELIRGGAPALEEADEQGLRAQREGRTVVPERLLAPLPRPSRLFFCGVNYHDHVREVPGRSTPTEPSIFVKAVVEVTGPGDPIVLPRDGLGPDYEAELAVVVGRRTSRVTAKQALDNIFGYTVVNDVSARAIQFDHSQLILGKGLDTFCPMGPELVTADEIPDPLALQVRSYVNGELRQHCSTAEMIFSPQEIIAFISDLITLEPGDVVSTGTPSGVGAFRDPPLYLQPGDEVSVEVEGIGRLTNPVVAAW